MRKFFKFLEQAERYTLFTAVFSMLVLTFLNVIFRRVPTIRFAFVDEIIQPLMVFMTFMGAAILARRGGHVGLTAFTDLLPDRYQKYVKMLTAVVAFFFSVLMLVFGSVMVVEEYQTHFFSAALHVPQWVYGMSIPVGSLFMTLEFLLSGVTIIRDIRNKKAEGV